MQASIAAIVMVACGSAPPLTAPVTLPGADHASAEPGWHFLGPPSGDAVARLSDADVAVLCAANDGAAYERLLGSGLVDWRAIAVTPWGVVIGAEPPMSYAGKTAIAPVVEAVGPWRAADEALATRCGHVAPTEVLVAVDASLSYGEVIDTLYSLGVGGVDMQTVRFAVADAKPDTPVPAPAGATTHIATFLYAKATWQGSYDGADFVEVSDVADAVRQHPGTRILLVAESVTPWTTVLAQVDAMSGGGASPILGMSVGADPAISTTAPAFSGSVAFAPDAPIAVLSLAPPRHEDVYLIPHANPVHVNAQPSTPHATVALGAGETHVRDPALEAAVLKVVQKDAGQLKYCYESQLKSNPELGGRVEIAWTVHDGRVTAADVFANTTGDSVFASCIVVKVRRWSFPPEVDGDVRWPFVFKMEAD